MQSDKFHLPYGDLSSLDEPLTAEFSSLTLSDDWSVVGNFDPGKDSTRNVKCQSGSPIYLLERKF